jgi:beta-galactosidase
MSEADLETHGLRGLLASDPRWANSFLDRVVRLVERDKNHPAVISWSLGNESGWGPNLAAAAAWAKTADPTRFVHYEGAQGMPDPREVDVISRFYPRVQDTYLHPDLPRDDTTSERPENARWERLLDIVARQPGDRPILASEYAHAMGNAMGNLREYWQEIESHPRLLGGFIWDWADQALIAQTDTGKSYFGYGGAFGDEPHHGAFCLNGIVMADRSLTAKYHEVKKVYQPIAAEIVAVDERDDGITNLCWPQDRSRAHVCSSSAPPPTTIAALARGLPKSGPLPVSIDSRGSQARPVSSASTHRLREL